jgi:hypothetical protein
MHGTNVKIIKTIISPVCHIRKEHRLRMCRQKDAEQKVWAELGEVKEGLEQLHNDYFNYYYS